MAVARRAGGADSFPEYFHVARDMPEETELQVHEEAVRKTKGTHIVRTSSEASLGLSQRQSFRGRGCCKQ